MLSAVAVTRSRNRGMRPVSICRAACAKSRWCSNLLGSRPRQSRPPGRWCKGRWPDCSPRRLRRWKKPTWRQARASCLCPASDCRYAESHDAAREAWLGLELRRGRRHLGHPGDQGRADQLPRAACRPRRSPSLRITARPSIAMVYGCSCETWAKRDPPCL